jgi:hypothetical protein
VACSAAAPALVLPCALRERAFGGDQGYACARTLERAFGLLCELGDVYGVRVVIIVTMTNFLLASSDDAISWQCSKIIFRYRGGGALRAPTGGGGSRPPWVPPQEGGTARRARAEGGVRAGTKSCSRNTCDVRTQRERKARAPRARQRSGGGVAPGVSRDTNDKCVHHD